MMIQTFRRVTKYLLTAVLGNCGHRELCRSYPGNHTARGIPDGFSYPVIALRIARILA